MLDKLEDIDKYELDYIASTKNMQVRKQYILYGRNLSNQARYGYGEHIFQGSSGQALWVENLGEDRRYPERGRVPCEVVFPMSQ